MRRALLSLALLTAMVAGTPLAATARVRTPDLGWRYAEGLGFTVEIEGLQSGFVVSADDLTATVTDATRPDGPLFEVTQSIVIDIPSAGLTDGAVTSRSGQVDASVTSVATGTSLTWQPRVQATATCAVWRGDRSDPTCAEVRVVQELTGSVLDGRTTCGTLSQRVAYTIVDDDEWPLVFGGFEDDGGYDGSGRLTWTNTGCRDAIYGVMPGDNITLTGRQSATALRLDGAITGQQGRRDLADITFDGRLRNGLPFAGTGEARLTFDATDGLRILGTATGDVTFTGVVGDGEAAIAVEGRGRLEVVDVQVLSDGTFTGSATLSYLASSTEGATTD